MPKVTRWHNRFDGVVVGGLSALAFLPHHWIALVTTCLLWAVIGALLETYDHRNLSM